MDPALLDVAKQYGLPGLVMLAFAWWILRQDKKLERREREHDKAWTAAELSHANALESKRRDFLLEIERLNSVAREERKQDRDAFLAAIERQTTAIEAVRTVLASLVERVARLEQR